MKYYKSNRTRERKGDRSLVVENKEYFSKYLTLFISSVIYKAKVTGIQFSLFLFVCFIFPSLKTICPLTGE